MDESLLERLNERMPEDTKALSLLQSRKARQLIEKARKDLDEPSATPTEISQVLRVVLSIFVEHPPEHPLSNAAVNTLARAITMHEASQGVEHS